MITINVQNVAAFAMLDTDGAQLKDMILSDWDRGEDQVVLDFSGVDLFATPFFNASVGRLVLDRGPEDVNQHLSYINLSDLGQAAWKRSFDNAVAIRNDPDYRRALEQCSEFDE